MHKLLAVSLVSLLAGCSGGGAGGASSAGPASAAASDESSNVTDFTLTDIDGKSVSLSDHLGKRAIVMDFWATWCKPCIAELTHMQKVYEAKKGDLVVLAISMDASETEAQVAPTVKSKGWTFPVLLDSETRATSLYNPRRAAPYTIIIDRHGKILRKREGFNPGDEVEMEKDIEAAMK